MISTLPTLCSHLLTSSPCTAASVMAAITVPVSKSVASLLAGSQAAAGPIM
jgi:hypothetical protein